MPLREKVLMALTVVGFVFPNVMVAIFIAQHGVDLGRYFGDVVGTLPAAQFAADLTWCALGFIVWAAWDGPRSGVRRWWVLIPASLLIGLCFGLPLYLLMRERAL